MTDLEPSGFSHIDHLLQLVGRTRELLDAVVSEVGCRQEGRLPGRYDPAAPRRGRGGFPRLAALEHAGLPELRYLLEQVGALRVTAPRSEAEVEAREAEAQAEAYALAVLGRPRLEQAEPWNLAALAHARLVLAFLPRLPEWDVRFPVGRRTYADIAAPRGPAELADRIVEIERQLWRAATGRPVPPLDPDSPDLWIFDAAERLGRRAFGLN